MSKIHIILQGKGGVGKSLIAAVLAQYKASKGQNPLCIDTDPVNATFNGFKQVINGERIDWILASPRLAAVGASIERTRPVNTFASEHFMVTAHLLVLPASP